MPKYSVVVFPIHSALNGARRKFELGHFDLPNQLYDCIPGEVTFERCDHVYLVSAAPSWHVPLFNYFLSYKTRRNYYSFLDTKPLFWAPCPNTKP